MPDTRPAPARYICERLRLALESLNWPRHPERKITMSIGAVGAEGVCAITAERWLEMADQNLYTAKRSGRNRVMATYVDGNPVEQPARAAG